MAKLEFTEQFGRYVCDEAKISCVHRSIKAVATVYYDNDSGPPWKTCDGHGPVTNWTSRPKHAGERILSSDSRSHHFYDFAEAVKIARRDGWGSSDVKPGATAGEIAVAAAEADFRYLKAWCDDVWHYVGVDVAIWCDGVRLTNQYKHALWGIDCNTPGSDNKYLTEIANELLDDALDDARKRLTQLSVLTSDLEDLEA